MNLSPKSVSAANKQDRFDPEEPEDLDEDVQWRLRVLKYMDRVGEGSDAGSDERDLKNRNAIVKAYRQQKLKVQDGQITVWFAGHMVMGPLSQRDFDFQDIIDDISKWTEQYGPGRIWVENVCHPDIIRFKGSDIFNRLLYLSQKCNQRPLRRMGNVYNTWCVELCPYFIYLILITCSMK